MRLGIDASNLISGGGLHHLVQLLQFARPSDHGFDRVFVWGRKNTIEKISGRPWLEGIHVPILDRSLPHRLFWQKFLLERIVKQSRCDLLFSPGGSDLSGFQPMVTMCRNLLPFEKRERRRFGASFMSLKMKLLNNSQLRTFRKTRGLIFLTRYAKSVIENDLITNDIKTVTIPHGIHERFFSEPRNQYPISSYSERRPFKLLYVSVISFYKHQWHVVEAVGRLVREGMPVQLDLIGPAYGPAFRRLERTMMKVDPNGKFIRYHGRVDFETLAEYYNQADMNVFASSCENMPNILLEGMAAGLPIACSNLGPMPEILSAGGMYFNPEMPQSIYDAIRKLIESTELRRQKANAAYVKAREFSWNRCAEETFDFLEHVARSSYGHGSRQ